MGPTDVQDKNLVEIERLLPGGFGLAHAEGLTLFVALAAPGDILRVKIERKRGSVGFASIVEVVKPSTVRVEPPCPYFGLCGGCDFQQLNYEAQLAAKVEILRDCLHRIARIETLPDIVMVPSPAQWQYRSRANWQFDPKTKRLGYFARGSHDVCDVEVCAVLRPELQQTLERLREQMREGTLSKKLTDIEAVAGDEDVSLASTTTHFRSKEVSRRIGIETYYFGAEAFFQINHELLELLLGEAIRDEEGKTAIDLYAGVGLFTLPLARKFDQVTAVEANARAVDYAQRNLDAAELDNVEVANLSVAEWLKHWLGFERPEFLLLDPPRTGAESGVIEGILSVAPQKICYVSCDPATLARDLNKLLAGGYSLDSIVGFDMFPQTHHVETVARLSHSEF
ncbi:MAG: class I SAM-dependent RNA methyltransferase [bacterium]